MKVLVCHVDLFIYRSSGFKGYLVHFLSPSSKKQKNIHPEKNSFYFRRWNFLTLRLKKFLYIRKWNPTLFGQSSKNKKNPSRENFLYFKQRKPRKNFLYSLTRKLFWYLIFPETETSKKFFIFQENRKAKKTYVSANRTFLYFRKDIFRTLTHLELEAYSEHYQTSAMTRFAIIATKRTFLYSRE